MKTLTAILKTRRAPKGDVYQLECVNCDSFRILQASAFTQLSPRLGLWNAFTPPLKSGWSTARDQSLVARKADSSGLTPFGPVVTYAKALMEGGKSKGEEVAVTKEKRGWDGGGMGSTKSCFFNGLLVYPPKIGDV